MAAHRPASQADEATVPSGPALDAIAREYVKLVLAVGQHDAGYVDAYYGPEDWRADAIAAGQRPIDELAHRADELLGAIDEAAAKAGDQERVVFLRGQLRALRAYAEHIAGRRLAFDEEALALYQVRPPNHTVEHFEQHLQGLGELLGGDGPVHERYHRFRKRFDVDPCRVDVVFRTAIAEARARTLRHVTLPPGERFQIEYVTGKPWSGYNWFKGSAVSVIQVNTDLPIAIDRALDLAAHEGYPGHHVYNSLIEWRVVRQRGWIEASVYPLYSPQSTIAEGTANFGIEVAFPGRERVEFERDVLFPLAGLDNAEAARHAQVRDLAKQLAFAGNEAARDYLDGRIDRGAAERFLVHYALMTPAQAGQRVRFFDVYRSYVVTYNVGERLVGDWVARRQGSSSGPASRWQAFATLLDRLVLPELLRD